MSVFRIEKTNNYTVMSNYHLREREMSLKAKGLLSLMLSLPNDWDYTIEGLVTICKENETAIKSTLKELKDFGYLEILKVQNQKGQFEYQYNIYEKPQSKKPELENLGVENPSVENQGQLNTNKQNTNKQNIKNKKEKKEKAKTEIDLVITESNYSDDLKNMIYEFIKMRKTIKKPMTTIAVKRLINKLDKLSNDEKEKIFILDKSIFNSWQDIYPLKSEDKEEIKDKHEEYEHELTYTADDFTPEQYDRLMRKEMSKEEMIQILKEKKNV